MQKRICAVSAIFLFIIMVAISCKKGSTPAPTGNVPHALSDSFYVRALLDTTWIYTGDDNKDECQISGGACSSFVVYGRNGSILSSQFNLMDSAHPAPKDSTILSWAGKIFVSRTDTSSSHALTFSFSYPDSVGRTLSSDYILNNTGAKLSITSVTYDGLTTHTFDSITPYKSYRVQGLLTCKVTHFGDTAIHNVTQGVFMMNVIEAQ